MAINFQPLNLKQAEFVSAKDILSDSRKIRDDKRKYAIESAMREGVGSTGDYDPEKIRKSLIASGFGEDADAVVRDIANKRLSDVSTTADIGVKLKSLVDLGIISQEKAAELFGKTTKAEQVPVEQIDNSWMQGVPSSNPEIKQEDMTVDGTVNITGSSMVPPAPTYEHKITNKKGQAVTDVASDMFDFSKKPAEDGTGISTDYSASFTKYNLPADKKQSDFIESAFQNIGIAAPGKDVKDKSAYYQKELTGKAVMLAGPMPEFGEFIKGYTGNNLQEARAEFAKAKREWAKNVAENYDKIIGTVDAARGKLYGETLAGAADTRAATAQTMAEEAQTYSLAGQKDAKIFAREVSPEEAKVVKLQRATIEDINSATNDFAGAYKAAVAKAKSDGSVNQDAIVANLVAMGAMPSSEAIQLRALMNPDGSLTNAAIKYVTNKAFRQKGPSAKWKASAIDNINQFIKDNGGVEFVAPKPKSAKDVLESKVAKPPVIVPPKKVIIDNSPRKQGESLADYYKRRGGK